MINKVKHYTGMACMIAMCVAGASTLAYASTDKAEIQQQFQQTFEQMLTNPADLDLTMKYAELAIQLEDYEAAIPALERMLMFNPDLPETKLQLGILYYKLHSMDVARTYLNDAKNSKDVSRELQEKADYYLGKM